MSAYLRQRTTARSSGAVVELYDTTQPDNVFDPVGGRWVTICEHGSLVNHATLALARRSASAPEEFCEECHAAATGHVHSPDPSGTVYSVFGSPCPAATSDDYPLSARCTCGANLSCEDGTADWRALSA